MSPYLAEAQFYKRRDANVVSQFNQAKGHLNRLRISVGVLPGGFINKVKPPNSKLMVLFLAFVC